ncbi:DUF2809 domain-containing protein [Pseudoclavibacter sp. JSM 162008]|uniref:ribosomal maturation YjgA family protein n=1 Tax=Pseudoclavibacter sp. JSM 162008 TaxID=3229855 RepID=UPI003523EE9D
MKTRAQQPDSAGRVTPAGRRRRRRRAAAAVLLAVTVALGLATHCLFPEGAVSDIAGDALYTVAVYLGVMLLAPRARPWLLAALAVGWSFAVEFLQLTELPHRAAEAFAPTRLVLGAGFDPRDLLVYALAGVLACAADLSVHRIRARRLEAPRRAATPLVR